MRPPVNAQVSPRMIPRITPITIITTSATRYTMAFPSPRQPRDEYEEEDEELEYDPEYDEPEYDEPESSLREEPYPLP